MIKNLPLSLDPLDFLKRIHGNKSYFLFYKNKFFNEKDKWSILVYNPRKIIALHKHEVYKLKKILKNFATRGTRHEARGTRHEAPFTGGLVGYFAYDLKNLFEKLYTKGKDDMNLPYILLGVYDTVYIYNHTIKQWFITSLAGAQPYGYHPYELTALSLKDPTHDISAPQIIKSNLTKSEYYRMIKKAKKKIYDGEIYQVNLCQRFEFPFNEENSITFFKNLVRNYPSNYNAILKFPQCTLISNSPEEFLSRNGSYIRTRPIKGTIQRSKTRNEDLVLKKKLRISIKDRAEHVMITDVERNDLGKICVYGTVKVEKFMALESYKNVYHLVSTISGKLRKNVSTYEILQAMFPSGSVTGAPKISAMQIIDELESHKRGIYTGAFGFFNYGLNKFHLTMAIRTLICKNHRGYLYAGGGIVMDSEPVNEYLETYYKVKNLMTL